MGRPKLQLADPLLLGPQPALPPQGDETLSAPSIAQSHRTMRGKSQLLLHALFLFRFHPVDNSFAACPNCVTLARMGSKDKGKKEVKKAPKPKPKPEPGRKREGFAPAPPK